MSISRRVDPPGTPQERLESPPEQGSRQTDLQKLGEGGGGSGATGGGGFIEDVLTWGVATTTSRPKTAATEKLR
jgi:hypothetical protein